MFQQLRSTLLPRMPSQTLLWQKLAFSSPFFYSNYLYYILLFRRPCDVALFNHHLKLWRSCSFRAYPFNRSVMFSAKFFSSYQVSQFFSTRVVPIPSCPLYSSFIALQPPRFKWCSLFLFSTAVLSIVFNSVVLFLSTFQPLKVLWFHSLVEEAT